MSEVELKIEVEKDKALKALDTFEREAGKNVFNVEKAFGALKGVAAGAVAYLGAREVVGFFAAGVEAANAQEQSIAQLGNQLKLTGEFSQQAVDHFAAFADEMERTTKHGDDLILSQVAVAKSFGASNEEAEKLVKAASELAAATGEDLEGSVKRLGQTFSGTAGLLSKQVPALKGLSKEALVAGDAIDIVLKRFSGSAEAEINTFAGATLQAENAFGNLQEAFGKIIVENPTLIAAVKAVTELLGDLQATVEDNEEAIGEGLSGSIKVLGVTMSATTDVVAFFIRGFQGLVNVTNLVQAGFTELISLVGMIPGVSDDTAQALNDLRDSTFEMAANTEEGFQQFNNGIESFQEKLDGAVQKVFDADHKVAASGKKAAEERSKAHKRTLQDAKDAEKERADALKLEKELTQESLDEIGKVSLKYKDQIDAIQRFEKAGVIEHEKAADLRLKAERELVLKTTELHNKAAEHEIELARKNAEEERRIIDEQRKLIEEQTANPLVFTIKRLEIDPSALKDFQGEIASGVGVLNSMLDGADGAKSFVSGAAGAFADALVPGIGGAVSQIVGKLAEGPDAVKAQIRAWIDAMPEIMDAVGESIPAVVEALVDSLINEGGAIRIGLAIGRAMSGEGIWKAVGAQLGIEVGNNFNAEHIGHTIGTGFQTAITDVTHEFQELPAHFKAAFEDVFHFFRNDVGKAIRKPLDEFVEQVKGTLDGFDFPTIPRPAWVDDLLDGLDSLDNLSFGGGGGKPGGVVGQITSGLGFATGGEIPPGFPNDTFQARLTSTERVLNRGDSRELKDLGAFVRSQGQSGDAMLALMAQMLQALQQPLTPQLIEFKMDQGVLGKGMLQLSRRNVRTTA